MKTIHDMTEVPKNPMLTVMNDTKYIAQAAQSGVTGFIRKPITLTDSQLHIHKIAASIKAT